MIANRSQKHEEHIAELTQTAYRAVLEQGFAGSFLDLELSLWNAIRTAIEAPSHAPREREKLAPVAAMS